MRRRFGEYECYLAIPSSGRPERVGVMHQHLDGPATWYVPADQADDYADAGAEAIALQEAFPAVRSKIMDDAHDLGLTCVQVDDDLKRAAHVTGVGYDRKNQAEDLPAWQLLARLLWRLQLSDFRLGGCAPTFNAYFTRHATSTASFVRSGLWAVKPTDLRVDPELRTKEDYDYTLQHVVEYGGVCRCDDLLVDFAQRTNAGGVQDYRTPEVEDASVAYLLDKWPGMVRKHATRAHEVTLTIRRERTQEAWQGLPGASA